MSLRVGAWVHTCRSKSARYAIAALACSCTHRARVGNCVQKGTYVQEALQTTHAHLMPRASRTLLHTSFVASRCKGRRRVDSCKRTQTCRSLCGCNHCGQVCGQVDSDCRAFPDALQSVTM